MRHGQLARRPDVHLAPHVHFCRTKGQVVFLDLKRDKYLGLTLADAYALSHWIEELPKDDLSSDALDAAGTEAHRLLQQMMDVGMLTVEATRVVRRANIDPPSVALIDGYAEVSAQISTGDVLRFAFAATRAKLLLRRCSLENIARRVSKRRLQRTAGGCTDLDRLRRHVVAFTKLRTFAFTANNECLFDSLALLEFLAHFGVFPNWVFGVATSPFVAHCWLQYDDVVLNDSPEHVGRFTQIMAL